MQLWLDAHLSPELAPWIASQFGVRCESIVNLGLDQSSDHRLFDEAKGRADAIITKDSDFAVIVRQRGAPPSIVLLTCGNTSNRRLRELLLQSMPRVLDIIKAGESLVELG